MHFFLEGSDVAEPPVGSSQAFPGNHPQFQCSRPAELGDVKDGAPSLGKFLQKRIIVVCY